jgi:hypothetical protein
VCKSERPFIPRQKTGAFWPNFCNLLSALGCDTFRLRLRQRYSEQPEPWLEHNVQSGIAELVGFARHEPGRTRCARPCVLPAVRAD